MVVGQERAVALEEVEQVGHQLQVGRDVRVVPEEVHVVERERHHVLDAVAQVARRVLAVAAAGFAALAAARGGGHRGPRQAQRAEQRRRAGGRGDAEPGRLAACASSRVPSSPHELFLSRVRRGAPKPAPRESPRCHAFSPLRRGFKVSFCVNLVKLWSLSCLNVQIRAERARLIASATEGLGAAPGLHEGRGVLQERAEIWRARAKSLAVRPPAEWVLRVSVTLFHVDGDVGVVVGPLGQVGDGAEVEQGVAEVGAFGDRGDGAAVTGPRRGPWRARR